MAYIWNLFNRVVRKLLVFALVCVSGVSWAQQDPQLTQYMFNNFYFNPAFAGLDGVTKITALHRSQWLGYSPTFDDGGAPTTQLISAHSPMAPLKGGVGGYFVYDNLGAVTNMELQASYAYYIPVATGRLSLGVRAGMVSQKVDFDKFRAIDPNDPLLGRKGTETQMRPDFAFGAAFRKEKFYVGAGVNHLTEPSYDFGLSQDNQLKRHLYVTGAYFYDMNFDLRFQFAGFVKSDLVKTSFDLGVLAYLRNTMWGGLSFRQSDAISLLLGYSFLEDKSLSVGYALDYIINDQEAKEATSHEFMISYSLPVSSSRKKAIRTPRFRY
jgi:type IX secretion system PorP/SprF family membrane protein